MRILCLIGGSQTEARTLVPVIRALASKGADVRVLVTQHLFRDGRFLAVLDILKREGIEFSVPGFVTGLSVDKWLNKIMPTGIVAANDCLVLNRLFLIRAQQEGIPFFLVEEAPSASLLGPVNNTIRDFRWLARNFSSALFIISTLVCNRQWRELISRLLKTITHQSLNNRGYGFGPVDISFVFSEFDRSYLRSNGALAKEIVVSGLPGIPIHKCKSMRADRLYDCLMLSAGEGQFLMSRDEQIQLFTEIVTALKVRNPNAKILFKPHPLEDPEVIRQLGGMVDISTNLEDAFDQAKVAIGTVTTSLFQALLAGLPILVYSPDRHQWPDLFILRECREQGMLARDEKELARLLDDEAHLLESSTSLKNRWSSVLDQAATTIASRVMDRCQSSQVDV